MRTNFRFTTQIRAPTMTPDGATTDSRQLPQWEQQIAKAKFSEVLRRARAEGPQLVTTRGERPVVVLAAETYEALVAGRPRSFLDLLLPGDELVPERADAPAQYQDFVF